MTHTPADCRSFRRDIPRRDELDPVDRGRLDLHLRRCDGCRRLTERFAAIEAGPAEIPPVSEERINAIHDRLIPLAHELAARAAVPAPGVHWLRPALVPAALAALMLAALAIVAAHGRGRAAALGSAGVSSSGAAPAEAIALEGAIDRGEGSISIDGEDLTGPRGGFIAREGTPIVLGRGARFGFRIGADVRVALADETVFRLSRLAGQLVEFELSRGQLAVEFDGNGGRMLDVRTPDSLVRVRGTTFTVEVIPGSASRVGVIEGRVAVLPAGESGIELEVAAGEVLELPGGAVAPLDDEQRVLAADLAPPGGDDLDLEFVGGGRLVRFAGSPERVVVEVEGRVVGITPLTVRLPDGPLSYRLTAPGMEPLAGRLDGDRDGSRVGFELAPAVAYLPRTVPPQLSSVAGRRRAPPAAVAGEPINGRWDLYQRARAAMAAGDLPYAIGLLERAVEESAGESLVGGLSLLADCYSAVGSYARAARTFNRVAGLVPGTETAQNSRYEVGRLAADRLGDHARARAAFTSYLASPVGGALREDAWFSLCKLDGREAKHREALHCYNEFLRAFPGGHHEAEARLWRGALTQDIEKQWVAAERDLIWFIEARPRHPRTEEARYRVALGRFQGGDRRGALKMISEYLREHPDGQYRVRIERLRRAALDPSASKSGSLD
jgi:tetratricopeptide (TPR) repeat protein